MLIITPSFSAAQLCKGGHFCPPPRSYIATYQAITDCEQNYRLPYRVPYHTFLRGQGRVLQ